MVEALITRYPSSTAFFFLFWGVLTKAELEEKE